MAISTPFVATSCRSFKSSPAKTDTINLLPTLGVGRVSSSIRQAKVPSEGAVQAHHFVRMPLSTGSSGSTVASRSMPTPCDEDASPGISSAPARSSLPGARSSTAPQVNSYVRPAASAFRDATAIR